MGAVLEAVSPFEYEHWMPGEEPTFYVPATVPLTAQQRRILQQSGFAQGEPFLLTQDGQLSRPESKKFAFQSIQSGFSVLKDSVVLHEEAQGTFSLEFKYCANVCVDLEVHCFAKDVSFSNQLRVRDTQLKWGPFRLSSTITPTNTYRKSSFNHGTHTIMHENNGAWVQQQVGTQGRNGYSTVTSSDADVDSSAVDKNASIHTEPEYKHDVNDALDKSGDIRTTVGTTGVYQTWASRKLNLQPSRHIDLTHLPSLAHSRALLNVYDIVLIATPIIPAVSSAAECVQQCAQGAHKSSVKTSSIFGARKKVIPAENGTVAGSSSGANKPSSGTDKDNPDTTSQYQLVNSADAEGGNVGSNTDSNQCENRPFTHNKSTGYVEKEAFYYRINADSYVKRHQATKVPNNGTATSSAGANKSVPNNSAAAASTTKQHSNNKSRATAAPSGVEYAVYTSSDEIPEAKMDDEEADENDHIYTPTPTMPTKCVPRSSVFMRSRPIQLDCVMQLFQVQSGVYNRITLYGMEGFSYDSIDSMVPQEQLPPVPTTSIQQAGGPHNRSINTQTHIAAVGAQQNIGSSMSSNIDSAQHHSSTTTPYIVTSTSSGTHASTYNNNVNANTGAECIICLTNKQTTIMFPCRHLCLCAECAKTLATRTTASVNYRNQDTTQEKKCPVCRKPVIVMFQLK